MLLHCELFHRFARKCRHTVQSAKGPNKCSAKLVLTLRKCVVCNQEGDRWLPWFLRIITVLVVCSILSTMLTLRKSTLMLLYRCSSGCFHIVTAAHPQRSVCPVFLCPVFLCQCSPSAVCLSSVSRHSAVSVFVSLCV